MAQRNGSACGTMGQRDGFACGILAVLMSWSSRHTGGDSMRKTLLSSIALGVLFAGSATAADMPVKALPPPVFSWTGLYIGANGGGVWGTTYPHLTVDDTTGLYYTFGGGQAANVSAVDAAGSLTFRNHGYTVGGQIGYNYQADRAVFGVEADFEAFRPKGSSSFAGVLPPGGGAGSGGSAFTINNSSSASWLSTLRGRFGWTPTAGPWLMYVTAGVAVARMSFASSYADATTSPPLTSGGLVSNFAGSKTLVGAAFGAGTEWAFLPGWSLGAEFLFVSFDGFRGSSDSTVALPTAGSTTGSCPPHLSGSQFCSVFKYAYAMDESIVRAKLNYRFANP
jgi:outer membrane immunogenic protein